MTGLWLLDGPDPRAGAEPLGDHTARLGPPRLMGSALIDALERSDLRGRGGAGFPVGRKWRSVSQRGGPRAVLANGSEGEPLSYKDRLLMQARPHLVLDGALLAADAVHARHVVVQIGEEHQAASQAMLRALGERPPGERRRVQVVLAPTGYVSGEESAAVQLVNRGLALPTSTPPRPFESGIGGGPTLVQNVESLAWAALIARHGDAWYRSQGGLLVTVSGAVSRPGVLEVPLGTPLARVLERAGGLLSSATALLIGGYFGGWATPGSARDVPLHPDSLLAAGLLLGCGVIAVLPPDRCGVTETARIAAYLAGQSAGQCGPCVFGLRAVAGALERLAAGASRPDDLARLERWTAQLPGRGACRHPDGAAGLVRSALGVFAADFVAHQLAGRCLASPPPLVGAA
jgi:NADH:ubiquinone oxidoreductase subunit F (NADH-binding)